MTAEQAFTNILDNDETIVETFKPNKKRFISISLIRDVILLLVVSAFFIPFFVSVGQMPPEAVGIVFGMFGIFALIIILTIVSRLVSYDKTWYCYTNKRIIIRSGFIGADYKTLDFDMIGAMDVRVDLLDKLVKPNTGTIMFASAASPMVAPQSNGRYGVSGYMFLNIDNPYETYKRIKEYTSKHKDGVLNS